MSFLEKKIAENRSFFDESDPENGHQDRFLEKLQKQHQPESRKNYWNGFARIAAVAAVFAGLAYFIFWYSIEELGGMVISEVTNINLSTEIENAFTYYETLAKSKAEKIDQVALDATQAEKVKTVAKKQLDNLDATLAEIEKEYVKNPDNQFLKAALINNKRKKAEVMDNIIEQLDQTNQNILPGKFTNP